MKGLQNERGLITVGSRRHRALYTGAWLIFTPGFSRFSSVQNYPHKINNWLDFSFWHTSSPRKRVSRGWIIDASHALMSSWEETLSKAPKWAVAIKRRLHFKVE